MTKVTYLFGAGASAKALPIVGDIPGRINKFLKFIKEPGLFHPTQNVPSNGNGMMLTEQFAQFVSDLEWLVSQTINKRSVDTLAKQLYLKYGEDDSQYLKLKSALLHFFALEQLRVPVDPRYDLFLTSMFDSLDKEVVFPENVKIISWNYDYQIEKAFSEFHGSDNWGLVADRLGVYNPNTRQRAGQTSVVFKLNGSTTYAQKDKSMSTYFPGALKAKLSESHLSTALQAHGLLSNPQSGINIGLRFSWEPIGIDLANEALQSVQDTNVLVVIGYSFPFFNRGVDREIIRAMKDLKKVYIQGPKGGVQASRSAFTSIRPDFGSDRVIEVEATDQFYIPPEL